MTLKFTLQPAFSEKCFFQSTRTVNHIGGADIHDTYKAIPLPQPIKNTTTAATLKLERNYLIVSRREESYAEMKSEEYLSCLRTQLLILCTKPVALVSAQDQLCLTFTPIQSRGSCVEDLQTRSNRIANFTDSNLPWELYVPPQRADDQQFLYNITYSGGREFSAVYQPVKVA